MQSDVLKLLALQAHLQIPIRPKDSHSLRERTMLVMALTRYKARVQGPPKEYLRQLPIRLHKAGPKMPSLLDHVQIPNHTNSHVLCSNHRLPRKRALLVDRRLPNMHEILLLPLHHPKPVIPLPLNLHRCNLLLQPRSPVNLQLRHFHMLSNDGKRFRPIGKVSLPTGYGD